MLRRRTHEELADAAVALGSIAILPPGAVLVSTQQARTVVILLEGEAEVAGVSPPVRHGPGSILGGTLGSGGQRSGLGDVVTVGHVVALILEERDVAELLTTQAPPKDRLRALLVTRLEPRLVRPAGERGDADRI